jgi:hypothetical protein
MRGLGEGNVYMSLQAANVINFIIVHMGRGIA